MLVFDSKLTRYEILYEIDEAAMKFITLRRRSKNMIDKALAIPDEQWLKVKLPIPKRKYKNVKVHESKVALLRNRKKFRQIILRTMGGLSRLLSSAITKSWSLKNCSPSMPDAGI